MLFCPMQVKLSAVIITYNEEKNIERCLQSIYGVVDEIIVVDSFSTDDTELICKKFDVRFIQHEFVGHIEQKNWAKDQAAHDYVLSLDADEALDDELKTSIQAAKDDWKLEAYKMNRLTNYCGQWIYHSGWYPDTKTRLFNRKKGVWGGINPHDKFIPSRPEKIGFLNGKLLHYSFYTREEHLQQIEKFSTIGSKALFEKGVKSSSLKIFLKPLARFIKAFFIHKGFLDGYAGFTISRLSAYSNYLKYKKLKELQKQADK